MTGPGFAPASVIFDCDGVILQSNALKSDAFGACLKAYDPALVAKFVAWHKATGGVSRFYKFAHFFRDMLGVPDWQARCDAACETFGEIVSQGLRSCPTIPGFEALMAGLAAKNVPLAVNTGGAEEEIRAVFADRGLAGAFQAIFGSPTTKRDNMYRLQALGLIGPDSTYFGDAKLDFELARDFGLSYVYVAYESEWSAGAETTRASGGRVVSDLTEIAVLLPEAGTPTQAPPSASPSTQRGE